MDASTAQILGRSRELDRAGSLISGARNGRGSALLVVGDPGIGKTTILDEACRMAGGVQVIRADGYEAESSMPYATLQRLGIPLAAHLGAIPPRQLAALRIASGLDEGPPPDRYLVGLGALSLLDAASAARPLLCVVDDVHLVDHESLDVLAFVARRLEAESISLLLGTRPDARVDLSAAGVPRLRLEGLDTLSAVELLTRSASDPVDPLLAVQIAEETGGNPLALIDLRRDFTAHQLVGSSMAPVPVPVGIRLETHYLRHVEALPRETQLWLLVVAAESTGDAALIGGAAALLGLPADAATAAERARLASVHDTVAFRHQLVRAAVYNGMPDADRRRVHRALRTVASGMGRHEIAVWHSAAATRGTDEAVALELQRAADMAGGRGGTASRARLLARAADLTPDGSDRCSRLLAAAEAAAGAGAAQLALELLERVDAERADPVVLGRVLSLRAMLALFVADADGVRGGTATLLQAAGLLHGRAAELEQGALLHAFQLELTSEWAVQSNRLPELGRRLGRGAQVAEGVRSIGLSALSAHILLPYAEAAPEMRAAVDRLLDADDAELLEFGTLGVALTMALWDERACVTLLERTVRVARDAGALRDLDSTLWVLSLIELVRGDPAAAGGYIEQVRELRRAIGYDAEQVVNGAYLAWTGAPVEAVEHVAAGALASGFAGVRTLTMTGLSIREIADGHYRDAFERLRPMVGRNHLQVTYQQLPEFVEAGVRSGHPEEVRAAAERLVAFSLASPTPWILGVSERCVALLADDDASEAHYLTAIDHLGQATTPGDLGRAHLVYGEWLRRVKRRRDAREQLRLALPIFDRVGAPAFAGRARRELEATGEHVTRPMTAKNDWAALTPQEASVARLAAAGQTNVDIGARLFISANTVDYHLRKVFRKLEVTSRRQLAEHLDGS
uniref:helix-turn-helix transcriptional regulator n=1 Tax=Agromyces cerinus TaxID=33878 RepID=UPI0009418C22|nr:helix-turn-helix transcriptional regulator [Agromyces cerinus]